MNSLPIHSFRDQIVEAVRNNSVVVITAETGAGKSTQVPQYLLDEGYDLVVTQPRRLAARTVAERVAEEIGEEIGGTVGYRTAVDRQDSPATRCLFCTDGLALVRELMGQNKGVLVLDEVHEWNENMEVLVAWAKRQIEAGVEFKVVLMSATLEAEKLAAFFNGAPVISVPGRLFPVETKQAGSRLVDDVATLVAQNRNVLVFQPGKQEIEDTCAALKQMQVSAEILPLHGQLTPEEQSRCFKHYGLPKVVVSTNVAQTSVTIDDIDAVVDSGMERRIELVDGVEGLYLKPISLADATQRKGRAGRTKAGIYIDHCGASSRPDFPVAEIMRKRLDQTVLRLAIAGFDMEELEFFHQPNKSDIHDARRTLIGLGCMIADGSVTKIGKLVNRLPVSVQYARMLVEADRLGVVDDVLTVAAIMEQGGITVPPPSRNQPDRPDWRRMVASESESDVMGQLSVWEQAENMAKDEMREKGISLRTYFRAKEVRKHLERAVQQFFQFGSTGRREDILKAVCAGMVDHLYKGSYGTYHNGDSVERQLGTASLVRGADWLVGKPFDLQIKTRRGDMVLKLIELASKVNPMWLTEIAPQLVEHKAGLSPRYDASKDIVVSTTQVFFNGQVVKEEVVADPQHPQAIAVRIEYLYSSFQKPTLLGVDVNDEAEVVSPVQECIVGIHPETGEELEFFGTYRFGWYNAEALWVRDRSDAEAAREKFIADMSKRHEDNRNRRAEEERYRAEQAERERLRADEAEAARVAAEAEARRKVEQAERREAAANALHAFGYPEAHIWVPESGDVAYILAGKTSKVGRFVVQPATDVDNMYYNGRPYCFGDYKYRAWVAFGFGVRSKAQDFSGSGNLHSEVSLFVPKGLLSAGVYGVSEDEQGQFFFPVIHHNAEGVEVIPEINVIRKVRVSKEESLKVAREAAFELFEMIEDILEEQSDRLPEHVVDRLDEATASLDDSIDILGWVARAKGLVSLAKGYL